MKYLVNHKQFGTEKFCKLNEVLEYLMDDKEFAKAAALDYRLADGKLGNEADYLHFIRKYYEQYASEAGYTVVNNKEF